MTALTAADQFKTYDELEKRLKYVLGQGRPATRRVDEEVSDEDNSRGSYTPDFASRKPEPVAAVASASSDEDDALSYFQKLAEE